MVAIAAVSRKPAIRDGPSNGGRNRSRSPKGGVVVGQGPPAKGDIFRYMCLPAMGDAPVDVGVPAARATSSNASGPAQSPNTRTAGSKRSLTGEGPPSSVPALSVDIPRSVSCQGIGGPLLNFIAETDFARTVFADIETKGFAILRGVLSSEEAERELQRMWGFVETVNPSVRKCDSETWYPRGGLDPWPHAQRDMMQLHQAGWVFSDLREVLAARVFERIYGRKELHSSKDGFTFQRPTRASLKRRLNDHFDQCGGKVGLHCIQGSVALLDQLPDDGCFQCWPGSHRHHAQIAAGASRDWYILSDADRRSLEAAGCGPQRVPVGRGDVVLWRSDLAHSGASPKGVRDSFRAVVYICMLPACMTPASMYLKKQQAYEKLATGSHWPTKEEWFGGTRWRRLAFEPKPFFETPPKLTKRQEELYGLKRYNRASDGR
mmetsp:Transcript_6803/g.16937  ORF Transcript_6803/g.16937 Transcript_6803/m.16937 type:complete len:434 (+) Transcript_6803:107-1408(+)